MSSTSFSSSPPVRTRAVKTPYHKWRAHHVTWMTEGHAQLENWDTVTQYMNNEARKIGEPQAFNTPMVKAYHRFLRKKAEEEEEEEEEATMMDDHEEELDTEGEADASGDVEVEKFVKEAVVDMRESGKGKAKVIGEMSGDERADIMKVKSVLESAESKERPGRGYFEHFEYEGGMEWSEGMTWNGALVSKKTFVAAQVLLMMRKSTM